MKFGRKSGRRSDYYAAVIGALGLTAVVVWADLLGHGFGFSRSLFGVQEIANARIFFLMGYTISALAAAVTTRLSKIQKAMLPILFPVVGFMGTWFFGLSYHQEIFPANALAIAGLVCCGVGYFGISLLLYCELAKLHRISMALWSIAASLFLKTFLGDIAGTYASDTVQIMLATILPWIAFVCFVLMTKRESSASLGYYRAQGAGPIDKTDLCYLIVSVSVVIAAIRGLGHLGLWGEGFLGSPLSSAAGYVVVLAVFLLFAYGGLIRNCDSRMLKRFQPAFLILMGGFLLYVLQREVFGGDGGLFFSPLYLAVELFGHLASWAFVFTAIRTTFDPIWRFQGISDFSYGIVAIGCALLLEFSDVSTSVLAVAAAFVSMAVAVRPFGKRAFDEESNVHLSSREFVQVDATSSSEMEQLLSEEEALDNIKEVSVAEETESLEVSDAASQLSKMHRRLGADRSLSSREMDVFLLLAQGRSRPFICQELYLADGTVKTHISHIYRKFGVHSRQELLTVIHDALKDE